MDLKTVVLIVLRRWYVVIPLVVISVTFAAFSGGRPNYEVNAAFLLVSPVSLDADDRTNPLLGSRSGLNSVANVAAVVMHSEQRRENVADAGLSDDYLFSVANLEPFVEFVVVSDDPDLAIESATVLAAVFVDELAEQQIRFGASPGALARTELLEISAPTADYQAVRTKQAVYIGAGLLVSFLAAFALEGFAYMRSPRREEFLKLFKAEIDSIPYGGAAVAKMDEDEPAEVALLSDAVRSPAAREEPADGTSPSRASRRWSRGAEVSVVPRRD